MASINFNLNFSNNQNQNNDFKYKDIDMPIFKNRSNFDLVPLYDAEAVLNSLSNIFKWRKGQRILNQEFGNPLIPFIYEPINAMTTSNLAIAIKTSINKWEPRVLIKDIIVIPYEDQNQYHISIVYSIPTLNTDNINFDLNINGSN